MNLRSHPVQIFLGLFLALAVPLGLLLHLRFHWHPVLAWLAPANALAFCIWGYDKAQAKRGGFRVPELALHAMAFLGATPASFLAMAAFRHKTLKKHFLVLYAVFLLAQVAAAAYAYGRLKE